MNKFRTVLCILGLAAPFYTADAASHLESYLPDTSLLLVSVSDYTKVAKKQEASPIHDLVNDATIREILKPAETFFLKKLDEDSDKPLLSWEEIRSHLSGQMVMGLDLSNMIAELKSGAERDTVPSITFLAEIKDADGLADLAQSRLKEQEDDKDSIGSMEPSEQFQGVTIHHFLLKDTTPAKPTDTDEDMDEGEEENRRPIDIYFGHVANTFFIEVGKNSAHDIVDALKGKEAGTLAESDTLSNVLVQTEAMDAYLYINATPLEEIVDASIRKAMAPKEGEAPNPLKPTADAVIKALGMNSIKNCIIGITYDTDNVRIDSNLAVDTSFGLGRFFRAYGATYPTPDFIPTTITSVSATGFNLGTLFTEIKQMVFTASPTIAMLYQAQMAQIQQQTNNVDLEKDVIGNFDDGLVVFTLDDPDGDNASLGKQQQIFALKLKDSGSFMRGFDTILGMTPYAQKATRRDFSGTEITEFLNASNQTAMALAVKDNWLLLSNNPTAIQNTISADTKKSFWQSKEYAELGDGKLPAGGISVSYNDFDSLAKTILYAFAKVANESEPVKDGLAQPIDVNLIGKIHGLPYSICGKGYKTPEGISTTTYLLKK